eukprot:7125873-Alexandrium_andersonii.AAC.1
MVAGERARPTRPTLASGGGSHDVGGAATGPVGPRACVRHGSGPRTAAVPRHKGGHRTVAGWSGRRRPGRRAEPFGGGRGGPGGGPG